MIDDAVQTDFIGRDFELVDGDLVLTDSWDLGTLDGVENLDAAIRRRLALPRGQAASLVLDINGLWSFNADLGNHGYSRLSDPGNGTQLAALKQDALDCLNDEDRITILDVGSRIEPGLMSVNAIVDVEYLVGGTDQTGSVSVRANPFTASLEIV